MITLYWIFLILGGGYFIFSMLGIVGDGTDISDLDSATDLDFDGDDGGDNVKVFSLRVMAGAILGFSIGGLILNYRGYETGIQFLGGIVSAIIVAVAAYYLAKFLYGQQGSSNVTMKSITGEFGIITISADHAGGRAQAKILTAEGNREYTCRPADARVKLKLDDSIKVLSRAGTTLVVERIKN